MPAIAAAIAGEHDSGWPATLGIAAGEGESGGQGHLGHQVAGDQDGPAFGGQGLQELADPENPLGVEPVDRLVEDQTAGSARSAAAMPSRWPMPRDSSPARRWAASLRPTMPRTSSTRPRGDLVGGSEPGQVVAGGPAWMHGVASRSAPTSRSGNRSCTVAPAGDGDLPGCRGVEPDDHPHGGGFPAPVRAQETGDLAGRDREAEVVYREDRPVALGEMTYLDDRAGPLGPGRAAVGPLTVTGLAG